MIKLKRNSTLFTLDGVRSVSKKDIHLGCHRYKAIIKITYADEDDIVLNYGVDDRYINECWCKKTRDEDFEDLEKMLVVRPYE